MSGGAITASLVAAVAAVQATIASVPSITGADSGTLATLAAQVATAQGLAQQVQAFWDAALTAAGAPANFASGTAPAVMVVNVNALLNATQGLNLAFDCANKLGRLAKNVAQITS
jgi:hypothetical protein